MSNMIKTIKYNKVSGGRIQIMCSCFATDDGNNNTTNIIDNLLLHYKAKKAIL